MKKFISLFIIAFLTLQITYAQGTAGENAKYEFRQLIDMPTSGIMERGSVGIKIKSEHSLLPEYIEIEILTLTV